MGYVFAVSNQKGGVGKTTSCISLSSQLALWGKKVLLIDFDPQGNATSGLGIEMAEEGKDLYDVFFDRVPLSEVLRQSDIEGLTVAPSSRDLIGVEVELGNMRGRELILRSGLKLLKESYDYIFIDCPPSSGLLTLNALGAATGVLVPLQAEYYALEGISALMDTVSFVAKTFNPKIELFGVFVTMYDSRTNLSPQVKAEAQNYFNELMFQSVVPRSVKLSECPSHGLPICLYDPSSPGARAYAELATEIENRVIGGVPVVHGLASNA